MDSGDGREPLLRLPKEVELKEKHKRGLVTGSSEEKFNIQGDGFGEVPRSGTFGDVPRSDTLREQGGFEYGIPRVLSTYFTEDQRRTNRQLLVEVFPDNADEGLRGGLEQLLEKVAHARGLMPKNQVPPFVEIRWKNVSWKVTVPLVTGKNKISTVASTWKRLCCFWRPIRIQEKTILNKISGILRPGTMTLILGPPGSGKSSLLKCLSGRLPEREISGNVQYNGVDAKEVLLQNLVGLVSQTDEHLPHLTVRETFEFALQCNTPAFDWKKFQKHDQKEELIRLRGMKTDYVLKVLGLDNVADNIVGNELLRGISGGQRKRTTIGEILMRQNSVLLMDEISTGLDSATSFDIIRSLRIACKTQMQTTLMSLLQPSPEVVALFDDLLLMSAGHIVYHGPVSEALEYFHQLGFEPPPHKDRADFFQEVTTPAGRAFIRKDAQAPPYSPEEFGSRWKHSKMAGEINKALQVPFSNQADLPGDLLSSVDPGGDFDPFLKKVSKGGEREFARTFWEHQRILVRRQLDIGRRDRLFVRARLNQMIIVGVLVGTVFYQMSLDDFGLRMGLLFFTSLFLSLGNISNMAALMRIRSIFYKQRAANFFRTTNWVLSIQIVAFPVALLEAILLSVLVYWLAGLQADAGRFFIFVLTLFTMNLGLASFARFLGCALKDLDTAQPIAAMSVVLFVMFAGFLIAQPDIPSYWIWAYWLSPLSWGVRTLCLNEFKSPAYDALTPAGVRIGDQYLSVYGIDSNAEYLWPGVAYLVCFWLFFFMGQIFALHNFRYEGQSGGGQPMIDQDEEMLAEEAKLSESKIDVKAQQGEGFPFTPMSLVFESMSYTVILKREKTELKLLDRISGFARPGRMLALMGETGAGKTTLMDVLAARKTAGRIEGKILVNGFETDPASYARVLGYVEQMDIHLSTSTVREALAFSASLRLADVDETSRAKFVDEVMELLELDVIGDAVIGTPDDGLSTEQRKRVTIGVELCANPALLFLDEPTSGLDSRAAVIVMRVIRNIVKSGRTVICTIHQPSSEIFSYFDDLLLLQRGGKTAFFGPLGDHCKNLIKYLESFPETKALEPGVNPANWMLTVIGSPQLEEQNISFSSRYLASELKKANDGELKQLKVHSEDSKPMTFTSPYASPPRKQMVELLKRFIVHYWRTPNYNFLRLFLIGILALLFGSVFYQLDDTTEQGVRGKIAYIYFTTAFCGVLNMAGVLNVVIAQRAVYYRERASKTYTVEPFNFGMLVAEIPYLFMTGTIFVCIMYFMVGFNSDAADFFFFWIIFTTYMSMMTFYGQFLSIMFPTVQIAQTVGSAVVTIWNLFCGFLVPRPSIPNFWIWLYWLSPIRYALEALAASQFYCEGPGCPVIYVTENRKIVPKQTWDFITGEYGFNYDARWNDFIAILAFTVAFRLGGFLGLKYIKHITR